ncbi:MAG: hypothetical protein HUU01_21335 [Saprospiraceae bacterium]|nr:hypothetical protein [Saprospiraceae bacterium]
MKKMILFGLLAAAVVAGIAGYMMWNKPHQNMQKADADVKADATTLYSEYETDETAANAKYLGKIVEVSGTVRETTKDGTGSVKIMLDSGSEMGGIICELDPLSAHKRTDFQPGEQVRFKGKCDGVLMDVVLTRCVEVTN